MGRLFQLRNILILSILWGFFSISAQESHHRCGTSYLETYLLRQYPERLQDRHEIEKWTKEWMALHARGFTKRNKIVIPVVVHVVWFGADENISDDQIQSQIDVLNEDFNHRNIDQDQIPSIFREVVGDAGIEFCLATADPEGNPTKGIIRRQTSFIDIGDQGELWDNKRIYYHAQGGSDAWDSKKYLNIWVARMNDYLGYATKPGEANMLEDGVVIDPRVFGRIGQVASPLNLGRTTTHEVGHYLNLEHLWGDEIDDCTTDDFVEDTPWQSRPYYGCPEHPQISCGSRDQFMNFMDYVADQCMFMFTRGQKDRMLATLFGPRSGLLASNGSASMTDQTKVDSDDIYLYPNPATDYIALRHNSTYRHPVTFSLVNNLGHIVLEKVTQNEYIPFLNVASVAQGIYYVKINVDGIEKIFKVLIN